MKKIIIVCTIFLATSVAYSHEDSTEYRVVCKIAEGCPIINGTCPTCEIVGMGKVEEQFDYEAWGKELRESLRYMWDPNYFKNDEVKREPSWGWDGPTWKGLRVPYN
tara:strand:+ start:262 stop:582 length:321 start_codon:yes stop_codon:yes gene_type:complete